MTGRILDVVSHTQLIWNKSLKAARNYGVLLEIIAQPERLDPDDIHAKMTLDAAVKLVISTDAHRVEELGCMRYGLDQARRAWCEPGDVANAWSWSEFEELLQK
jgi:DNA polymerase (family X)